MQNVGWGKKCRRLRVDHGALDGVLSALHAKYLCEKRILAQHRDLMSAIFFSIDSRKNE